jgi:capsular polysaccharide transport system permease protein
MLFKALRIQARVVGALIVRELQARYGRDNLGFLWLMGEPLMFTLGVIAMWRVLRGPYIQNFPVVPLSMFGYLPLLLYRHMVNGSMGQVRGNSALLFHRQVTVLDLYLARVVTELAGNLLATITTFAVLYELDQMHWPANSGLVYLGYFYNAWWSAAVTAIIMPLSERSELVEKFWQPLSYMQLPICGAYVMAQWIPGEWRQLYLLWPSVSGYEMMRTGYFGDSVPEYWNQPYFALWCGVLTLIGLALIRDTRRYIAFE